MTNPLLWLSLSMGLLALSLILLLLVAIPMVLGMARVARSAEKLLDALHQELPPTLHSLRQTSADLSDLAEDVNQGVQGAGHVVKQVDQSLSQASQQAQQAQITTRSLWAGLTVAWGVFMQPPRPKRRQRPPTRRPSPRPPAVSAPPNEPAASHRSHLSAVDRGPSQPDASSVPLETTQPAPLTRPATAPQINRLIDGDKA
ncbi:MAG: DUF948 domain-containing protein [Cyanobacteria bacterium P01_D01_bin.44]